MGVTFEWNKKSIQVKSSVADVGNQDDEIKGKVEGKPGKFLFSPSVFLDGVEAIESDTVELIYPGNLKPIILKDSTRPDWTYCFTTMGTSEEREKWEEVKQNAVAG